MAEVREPPPPFMQSVHQLSSLASAINAFQSRFEELQKHLDFIQCAIDTKFNDLNSPQERENTEQFQFQIPSVSHHQPQILRPPTEPETTTTINTEKKIEPPSRRSVLVHLCEMMCSRGLRKYVVSHLSDIQNRREEAISALKSAPNPAKLVLDCVGRFFLQGSRAYTKDSPMISSRQASVLMLELFLSVVGGSEAEIEIEKPVMQAAESNAIAWRKRLISEGGAGRACEIDTRGLLLFIACFGIPNTFKNEDVRDLIRFSNLKEIGHLLKGSSVLAAKMPDVIESMKQSGMHVEAVDVVYTLGIEAKFSPYRILTSFLREAKEAWRRTKRDAPIQLKEANEKHLVALKSVIKCLEDRNIDPAKLLPGWQIKDKVVRLEKDIADLNIQIMEQKMMPKRKAGEIEPSNQLNGQEMKRSRFLPTNGSVLMSSPHVIQLHDPRATNYVDGKSFYDSSTPNLSTISAASHIYNTGPLPDLGTTVGGGSSAHVVGPEIEMSPGVGTLRSSSVASVHREMSVDKIGQMMYGNGSSYRWHKAGDAAYSDRAIVQSFTGQPTAIGIDGLYRQSPSKERFAGLLDPPSIDVGNQSLTSDLYSFADSVI